MRHARSDYNRFQDPYGLIPEDEPVFLLRGKDKYAAEAVMLYADNILRDELATPEARAIAERALEWSNNMRQYGIDHGVDYPDMPSDV